MKTFRLLLVAIIFLYGSTAFSQTCQWANNIAGDSVRINSIATDKNGNCYITGEFDNRILFNSTDSLTVNEEHDIFIAKYNTTGGCLWTRKITGANTHWASRIALDSIGNMYIACCINCDSLNFTTNISLSDTSNFFGFLAKYDTSGKFQSGCKINLSPLSIRDMASDPVGNVYIYGEFYADTISFGNGKSLFETSNGKGFIVKFDANQQCVWAQKIFTSKDSAINYTIFSLSQIKLDNAGDLYISGFTNASTVKFNNNISATNTSNISYSYYYFSFITKYDTNGVCKWANNINGTSLYGSVGISSISIDNSRNIYFLGFLRNDSINFNNNINLSDSATCLFFGKYNSSGFCLSAKAIQAEIWGVHTIATNKSNELFLAGQFYSHSAPIDFGNGYVIPKCDSGSFKGAVVKFDSNGTCKWATILDCHGNDNSSFNINDISLCEDGSIFLGGDYTCATVKFNDQFSLNNTSLQYSDGGEYDGFIAKYSLAPTAVEETTRANNPISIYPNPSADYIQISLGDNCAVIESILIYNELGQLAIEISGERLSNSMNRISVSSLTQGAYRAIVKTKSGIFTQALSIIK